MARTAHFALHRAALDSTVESQLASDSASAPSQALFVVSDVWMGAMVPKRWAKRAVTRNSIKRQIYSVSADFAPHLSTAAHVIRLRAGFDRKQFISATSELLCAAVRLELQQLLARTASPSLKNGVAKASP